MPPQRSQGSTGFCYGFAATALLQDFYCKTKSSPCHYSAEDSDQLSVLDALAIGNYGEGGLVGGGSTRQVLEKILWKGGLAKEKCAPFTPFLKTYLSEDAKSQVKFGQLVHSLNMKILENRLSIDEQRKISAALKDQAGLATELEQIRNALGKKDASIVLGEVAIPRQCEDQRVPLKKFRIVASLGQDFMAVREKILNQLRLNVPLVTHICSLPPEMVKNARDKCGLHALVVSGIRERCCAEQCSYEYQFYDSDQAFGVAETSKDGWVSESIYAERLRRKWSSTAEVENLYWLEPGT